VRGKAAGEREYVGVRVACVRACVGAGVMPRMTVNNNNYR